MDVLRYESARQPGGVNVALLACRAFAAPQPLAWQTWRVSLNPHGVRAFCAFPEARLEFPREAFADDPRIAAVRWER